MANPQAIAGLNFSHGWHGHKFGDKWRIEQWIGDQWVRATWIDSPVLAKFFDDMANGGYQPIAGSEQHAPRRATHEA